MRCDGSLDRHSPKLDPEQIGLDNGRGTFLQKIGAPVSKNPNSTINTIIGVANIKPRNENIRSNRRGYKVHS